MKNEKTAKSDSDEQKEPESEKSSAERALDALRKERQTFGKGHEVQK